MWLVHVYMTSSCTVNTEYSIQHQLCMVTDFIDIIWSILLILLSNESSNSIWNHKDKSWAWAWFWTHSSYVGLTYQSHKSINASEYPPVYHFVQNGALWDMGPVHCGICELGPLPSRGMCTLTAVSSLRKMNEMCLLYHFFADKSFPTKFKWNSHSSSVPICKPLQYTCDSNGAEMD